MNSLQFSLDGRSSLYTVSPSKTISLDSTDWAPHEVLGSWILEHCQLENMQREAALEDQEDISARLKACEEQIDAAIEKLTISGPMFTPPDHRMNQLFPSKALKKNLGERFCPNLCHPEPRSPKYPARLEQKSLKTSELLKELQSPALEYDTTDCSSTATLCELDSFNSTQADSTVDKECDAELLSASRLDLKNFVKVREIPECDDSSLMLWAESSGVFNGISSVPSRTVASEAARKQRLHDAAVASRDSSRVWWVNVKDSNHVPEFESSSIDKLGTVEVEYKLSSEPPGLRVHFEESEPEKNEKIWQRRGVNPPNPIETDVRKPGTLFTVKVKPDRSGPAPALRKVSNSVKASKHGNALSTLAFKMRQLTKSK